MKVTLPKGILKKKTNVKAMIMDSASFQVLGVSGSQAFGEVTKPKGQDAAKQASAVVSFGKNPNNVDEIAKGVGVYSTPYCIQTGATPGGFGTNYVSNCGISTTVASDTITSDKDQVLEVMNAI